MTSGTSSRCAECGAGLPARRGEDPIVCPTCHRVAFVIRGGRSRAAPLPFVDLVSRDLVTGRASAVASSQHAGCEPGEAIDGHGSSMWRAAGAAPAWFCVDLDEIHPIRGVTLVPAMSPAIARVHHVVETCEAGEEWAQRASLEQSMTDAAVYAVDFGKPVQARWVRIRTERSGSMVGWYEVGIFG